MAKKVALLLGISVFMLIPALLKAQTAPDIFSRIESRTSGDGTIRFEQNENIRNMINLHLSQQRRINGIKGYKISIYRGSGQQTRKDAEMVRAKFLSKYENVKCELKFEYPNWKVYVGAFRTRSEALQFQKRIEYDYPDLFIREDIVPYPD
jgi:hypothetical protein